MLCECHLMEQMPLLVRHCHPMEQALVPASSQLPLSCQTLVQMLDLKLELQPFAPPDPLPSSPDLSACYTCESA